MDKKRKNGVYYTPRDVYNKLHDLLSTLNIKSVIDINCGDGALLRPWESPYVDKIVGLDIEPRYKYGITYDSLNMPVYTYDKFDLCVGNPPYRLLKKSEHIGDEGMNDFVHKNGSNLFIAGLYKAMMYDAHYYAFVVPKNFLTLNKYVGCRNYLLDTTRIKAIIDLGQAFNGVRGEQVCIILTKDYPSQLECLRQGKLYYRRPIGYYEDWVILDSLVDELLFNQFNLFTTRMPSTSSCNVKEGIRGRDLDKFRLKSGQYNANGDAVLVQRIYSAECGFKAVPASRSTRCNESVRKIICDNEDVLCIVGLLHSKLLNYFYSHYLFNDSMLTLKAEYLKYLPMIKTHALDQVVEDMMIHGWGYDKQKELDELVYILFAVSDEEEEMIEKYFEGRWSKKWLQ